MLKYKILVIGVFLIAFFILQYFFVVNTTKSFPLGVYQKTHERPEKGDLVLVCPPDDPLFSEAKKRGLISGGLCKGGNGYLIKKVMAVHGDKVRIQQDAVLVNGLPVKNSAQKSFPLRSLTPLKEKEFLLKQEEVFLMSDANPYSFDSRYFGPLSVQQIQTPLKPFLVWQEGI